VRAVRRSESESKVLGLDWGFVRLRFMGFIEQLTARAEAVFEALVPLDE
jgi:hypothetical protein